MCRIAELVIALFLIIAAYKDWRTKRVSCFFLVVMFLVILGMRLFIVEESLLSTIGGIAIGAAFLVLSKCTGESIGYGDSFLIFLLGIFLGGRKVLETVFVAMLFSCVFSIIYSIRYGWRRKHTIPFIPFLAAAYIGVVLL